MILDRLTIEAERAAQRYEHVTHSFRLLHHQAMAHQSLGAPAHMNQQIDSAYEVAQLFLVDERERANSIFREIASDAHASSVSALRSVDRDELSPTITEHLNATLDYLINELVAQLHRDVAMLRTHLQRAALNVSLKTRAGMSLSAARIAVRLETPVSLDFTFRDRTARSWSSAKLVRTIWRHTLLSLHNEVVLFDLADHGLAVASVMSDQGEQQRISLSGEEGLPIYAEVRETLFHPNANVYLEVSRVPS